LGGCFAAGTPILTPDGSKLIEDIKPGDWVITAPDDDSDAEPVPCQVEETFENYLPLLDLYVNGRTIRTTAEHPFWVRDRGWVAAQQLQAGDFLRAHDGRWLKVDGLEGPKPSATVYNMCVAEYHTYFVGHQIWGFAVWSHNMASLCGDAGGGAMRAQGLARLRELGLGGINLAGKSYSAGRKALGRAGFVLDRTTQTGRKVFRHPKTGAEVSYDSGNALVPGQKPHWHIKDKGGQGFGRGGRPVMSDEGAGHIPAG
jgi:hypothetical protein